MSIRVAILADFPLSALEGEVTGRGGGQGCTWLPQLAFNFEGCDELEVHWVILDRGIKNPEKLEALGQTFYRVPAASFTVDLVLNYWLAHRALKKVIHEINPDLVHAWGTERIYPAALRGLGIPSILSMQGVLTAYERRGTLDKGWRWKKMLLSEPVFLRAATVVTCESQWGIDRVLEVTPEVTCRMVEYGVHPSFFDVKWKPEKNNPYLLYIGSAGVRKGFDVLVDALESLPNRQWECHLVGDPAMADEIEKRGINGVKVLGMLNWDEMKDQIAGAWAVTLPTRADTSPNTVKESRVIGAPVVSTRHGGHTGYLQDGVNGLVIDELTAPKLASALADVMSSFERAKELGAGRHAQDREYLHPVRTAEGFLDLYKELAS